MRKLELTPPNKEPLRGRLTLQLTTAIWKAGKGGTADSPVVKETTVALNE